MEISKDANVFNEPSRQSNSESIGDDVHATNRLEPTSQSSQQLDPTLGLPADPDLYYDMSGEKILIIFNHFEYMPSSDLYLNTRHGTHTDVKRLEHTFRNLGFTINTYHELKHEEIMRCLNDVCNADRSKTSCVAIAVMTHGAGAYLGAYDVWYPVADITETMRSAPSLAGKPKLFFIQACRAKHTKPVPPPSDALDSHYILLFACYEDYVSFRRSSGSFLLQALCEIINKYHNMLHLTDMLTLVNDKVAKMSPENMKQMPVCEFFLQKYLKL